MDRDTQAQSRRLLRRTLVPLLIVALPISAMVAYILYHKKAQIRSALASVSEPASFGEPNWPIFRSDTALTGRATGNLPETLTLKWKFHTADAVRSTPIVVDNKVFVSSMDQHLYSIDLLTGTEIWKFPCDDELEASPLYHHGFVYVGSNSGWIYCVDSQTGQEQWSFEADGKITGSANIAVMPGTGKSVILFGSYDSNLYCLDAKTGNRIFFYPAENYINGAIAIANSSAVFGSCDANIYQVPIADPNSAKTIDAGSYVAANPAFDNGVIFAGSFEGDFIATDIKTQQILWRFNESEDAFFSSPAVNENVVIVGNRDQNVYCFDRFTGDKIWTFPAQDNFDSSPVICGDKVAVGCDDGRLYLLEIKTGEEVFSYTLGSPVLSSSAAIAKNHLIIGCDNGIVYAFVEKLD